MSVVDIKLELNKRGRPRLISGCGRVRTSWMNMRPCPPRRLKSGRVVPKGYYSTECVIYLGGVGASGAKKSFEMGRWLDVRNGWCAWSVGVMLLFVCLLGGGDSGDSGGDGVDAGFATLESWGVYIPTTLSGTACRPHTLNVKERIHATLNRLKTNLN